VEFEDKRDAEDAISGLNNYLFDGERISVEWSRKTSHTSSGGNSTCFICGHPGHWAK
jgi:RNA recognition motif-containing protein